MFKNQDNELGVCGFVHLSALPPTPWTLLSSVRAPDVLYLPQRSVRRIDLVVGTSDDGAALGASSCLRCAATFSVSGERE